MRVLRDTMVVLLAALVTLAADRADAKCMTAARRRAAGLLERQGSERTARDLLKLIRIQGYRGIPLHKRFVDASLGRDSLRFVDQQIGRLEALQSRRPYLARVIAELRQARDELRAGQLNAVSTGAPAKPAGRALPGYRFDEQRYRRHVQILAGERACQVVDPSTGRRHAARLDDRLATNPHNKLPETLAFLRHYYEGLGLTVEEQPFTMRGRRLVNLVVTIPGRSREIVVVGAHYDAAADDRAHTRRPSGDKKVSPGADDNGTGVAALMEAGRALRGTRPEKTVKIVHFSGEEQPGVMAGSRAYVSRLAGRGSRVAAAFIIDSIGSNSGGRSRVVLHTDRGEGSLRLGSEIAEAAARLRTRLHPVGRIPEDGSIISVHDTDSHPFSKRRVPVVFVNEDFHWRLGIHDRFDHTAPLDMAYAGRIVRATIEAVARVASVAQ